MVLNRRLFLSRAWSAACALLAVAVLGRTRPQRANAAPAARPAPPEREARYWKRV